MSLYLEMETQFVDRKALLDALQVMEVPYEVYDHEAKLYGYKGDQRPEGAHIIVRRFHLGPASNDLGFRVDGDKIQMVISKFDQSASKSFVDKLKKEYAVAATTRALRKLGYTVSRGERAGKVALVGRKA